MANPDIKVKHRTASKFIFQLTIEFKEQIYKGVLECELGVKHNHKLRCFYKLTGLDPGLKNEAFGYVLKFNELHLSSWCSLLIYVRYFKYLHHGRGIEFPILLH